MGEIFLVLVQGVDITCWIYSFTSALKGREESYALCDNTHFYTFNMSIRSWTRCVLQQKWYKKYALKY